MTSHYAYVHARPDTSTAAGIFYVGKGTAVRSRQLMTTRRGAHHQNIISKYGAENILIGRMECSSEEAAFELEIGLIKCLRRMGVALANKTDGGEGCSGFAPSEETKRKISASVRATWADPALREKQASVVRAAKSTPESKAAVARVHTGRKRGESTKAKLSKATTAQMANPLARAVVAEATRVRMQTPEARSAAAARMAQRMKDPANRERISLAAKAQWAKLRAVNPTATRLSVPQLQPVMDAAARKDGANS